MPVEFYRHSLGQDEYGYLKRALDSVFLTAGPLTLAFENELAQFLNCRRVVGTNSCTMAIFLCLKALGIGPGHEVITTPMTFMATSNAVLAAGARPVFVDVEKGTGNIDARLVEGAVTGNTKAILAVHLYGHMCDMKELRQIADRHGLSIIEDAAHCIEGERDGIRPGQVGDAACMSFYATKNMTSGEGGAIATNREPLAEKLMPLRSHGMDKAAAERYTGTYRHWDMVAMGYKGNMFDIQAALLLPQIPKLTAMHSVREKICNTYRQAFQSVKGLEMPETLPRTKNAHHLFTIWVDSGKRDTFLEKLQAEGIGVAVNYRPVHTLRFYREKFGFREGAFPQAERIGKRTISLPLYPNLHDHEVDEVVRAVRKVIG